MSAKIRTPDFTSLHIADASVRVYQKPRRSCYSNRDPFLRGQYEYPIHMRALQALFSTTLYFLALIAFTDMLVYTIALASEHQCLFFNIHVSVFWEGQADRHFLILLEQLNILKPSNPEAHLSMQPYICEVFQVFFHQDVQKASLIVLGDHSFNLSLDDTSQGYSCNIERSLSNDVELSSNYFLHLKYLCVQRLAVAQPPRATTRKVTHVSSSWALNRSGYLLI